MADAARVDLILQAQEDHMIHSAGTKDSSIGEHWGCRCGKSYKGDGAIKKGRRHCAREILTALERVGAVA